MDARLRPDGRHLVRKPTEAMRVPRYLAGETSYNYTSPHGAQPDYFRIADNTGRIRLRLCWKDKSVAGNAKLAFADLGQRKYECPSRVGNKDGSPESAEYSRSLSAWSDRRSPQLLM
jgi:hypothetical protein